MADAPNWSEMIPKEEEVIELGDKDILEAEEATEAVKDQDILEAAEDEEEAERPGEAAVELVDTEKEHAVRIEAMRAEREAEKRAAEDRVIELEDQVRRKEDEMRTKFSQLDARTDRAVAERQKKVFQDVYGREIGKLKEMSSKLRERHGITEEVVEPEAVEVIPETDADRQAEEKARLQEELAGIEAKLKRVELDLGPAGLKDAFERLSDQAATSAWGRLKLGIWKMRLSSDARKLVDESASLMDQKTAALKALSDFNAKPEEVMRMRAARQRGSEAASKKLRPGEGLLSK